MKILNAIFALILSVGINFTAFAGPRQCVDEAIEKMKIPLDQEFSSSLLLEVLEDEMYLGDFTPLRATIETVMANPPKIGLLVSQIKRAIENRHPSINEFLCTALDRGLLDKANAVSAKINRILHHTYILELLVQEMVASLDYMEQVRAHFLSKRQEFGLGEGAHAFINLIRATGDVFETAKMLTVDQTMDQYLAYRKKVKLTKSDLASKNRGLFANVMEATLADVAARFFNNARVGKYLALNLVKTLKVTGPNTMVEQHFVDGWASLYETWNLAFVTGRMNYLDLVYPKLIIPQVIDAEPQEYLYKRGITLWVTINIVLISKLQKEDRGPFGPFPEAATIWGKINRKYIP